MKIYKPTTIPFVQAQTVGEKNRPTAVVVRLTGTPSREGAALAIADYWHRPGHPDFSAHYLVDAGGVFQVVPDGKVAPFHSDLDKNTVSIMICAEQTMEILDWMDFDRLLAVVNGADLVRDLLRFYRIPPRVMDTSQVQKWLKWRKRSRGGVIFDIQGAWPTAEFMQKVAEN